MPKHKKNPGFAAKLLAEAQRLTAQAVLDFQAAKAKQARMAEYAERLGHRGKLRTRKHNGKLGKLRRPGANNGRD